jgi:hypothetical protein
MSHSAPGIAHIVTWRLNGATAEARKQQAQLMVQAFEAARPEVPGLLQMHVGSNVIDAPDAWDVALYMAFASRTHLEAYQAHPSHLAIKQLVGPMRFARCQVDFELPGQP